MSTTDRAAGMLRDDPSIRTVETYDHTITAEFEGQDPDMARLLGGLVQLRHRGAIVCRRAAFARGSLHDDHQGNRQLTRDPRECCVTTRS